MGIFIISVTPVLSIIVIKGRFTLSLQGDRSHESDLSDPSFHARPLRKPTLDGKTEPPKADRSIAEDQENRRKRKRRRKNRTASGSPTPKAARFFSLKSCADSGPPPARGTDKIRPSDEKHAGRHRFSLIEALRRRAPQSQKHGRALRTGREAAGAMHKKQCAVPAAPSLACPITRLALKTQKPTQAAL